MATDLVGFGFPLGFKNELVIIAYYVGVVFAAQLVAMVVAPKNDRLATSNLLLWLPVTPVFCYWVRKSLRSSVLLLKVHPFALLNHFRT